jgi:hypothetical protein
LANAGWAVVVLGALEIVVRLAGFGFEPDYFKRERVGGREGYVASEEFGLRFFPRNLVRFLPPQASPAVKSPDTLRIFIFGESAAMGDPRPNYSRCLSRTLSRRQVRGYQRDHDRNQLICHPAYRPGMRQPRGDLWIIQSGSPMKFSDRTNSHPLRGRSRSRCGEAGASLWPTGASRITGERIGLRRACNGNGTG